MRHNFQDWAKITLSLSKGDTLKWKEEIFSRLWLSPVSCYVHPWLGKGGGGVSAQAALMSTGLRGAEVAQSVEHLPSAPATTSGSWDGAPAPRGGVTSPAPRGGVTSLPPREVTCLSALVLSHMLSASQISK